jgi:hypothetical protein
MKFVFCLVSARPEFEICYATSDRVLAQLDKGDVLTVTRLDRPARSIQLQRPERDSAR